MGRFIILVVALGALWLLLSGYFDVPILLGLGAVSVLFSAWLAHRAKVLDQDSVPMGLLPRILGYWVWLAGEIGKANLAVMRQALAVEPKLSPKLFLVPNPPKSDVGKATFANSITLTPGTVSVDLREDGILVHGLTEELCDVAAITDMGERVARCERKA
ncbi:Na+/H+ antiporter subunit E [Hyphococcus sp.]|uniref:Na+/H+ antiporter subunit E n=1 Tax=Hyphococcus sp. TaxID=2038636 RepID=UPI002089D628|nr:MAG: sodium:proton antiporter [Marinicaulis sp.]